MHHGNPQNRMRPNTFSNGHNRNNFRQTMSPEKLFEKYSSLAKEAMSTGDKILSENYLQHADHFNRIIEDRNKSRIQNRVEETDKVVQIEKKPTTSAATIQDEENKDKN
tara:strand:+ start:160 stop:486 length:327 start_codon:yes stop_codon:yes gene_type:complete